MNSILASIKSSPVLARVIPFAVFIALTYAQEHSGESGRYWIYLAKTVAGAWMIWAVWPAVEEMRWKFSWEAALVGVAMFAIWVSLDPLLIKLGLLNSYPKMKLSSVPWNPHAQFGDSSALAWMFVAIRIAGSSLVVPPLEEVFFRSFLYRYLAKKDFQSIPLGAFLPVPFVLTAVLFALEHREWLAGILCGVAYQGLVLRKNRLGDAMTAHAITNFLLGLWVVWKGEWHFW